MGRHRARTGVVAIVLVVGLISGCAGGSSATAGPSIGGAASSAVASPTTLPAASTPTAPAITPRATPDLRPIPLPLATFSGTVLDPSEAALSLDDALGIARTVGADFVGPDPVARYMLLTDDTSSGNGGFRDQLVWVFVADDVAPFTGHGLPTTTSPPPYLGTLSWTIIDMSGHLRGQMQSRYFAPNIPPTLPR